MQAKFVPWHGRQGLVQWNPARGVLIDEGSRVVGGAQIDMLEVALLTAKRVVDIGMADQTVGHVRQVKSVRELDLGLGAGGVRQMGREEDQPAFALISGRLKSKNHPKRGEESK